MFTVYNSVANKTINLTAEAMMYDTAANPVFYITVVDDEKPNEVVKYRIAPANGDPMAYYINRQYWKDGVYTSDNIVEAYIAEDCNRLSPSVYEALPREVVEDLIRNRILIALANLYSRNGWNFHELSYDRRYNLDDELHVELRKFIAYLTDYALGN